MLLQLNLNLQAILQQSFGRGREGSCSTGSPPPPYPPSPPSPPPILSAMSGVLLLVPASRIVFFILLIVSDFVFATNETIFVINAMPGQALPSIKFYPVICVVLCFSLLCVSLFYVLSCLSGLNCSIAAYQSLETCYSSGYFQEQERMSSSFLLGS